MGEINKMDEVIHKHVDDNKDRDKFGKYLKGHSLSTQTQFKKGQKLSEETKNKMKGRIPWNKGKGVSSSKGTIIYANISQKGYVDEKGYRRFKIKGKTVKEHRLVWEQNFGKIPFNYDIHHKDGNKLNNHISNLELIHHNEHSSKSMEDIKCQI